MTPQEFLDEIKRIRTQTFASWSTPMEIVHGRRWAIQKLVHQLSDEDLRAITAHRPPDLGLPKYMITEIGRSLHNEIEGRATGDIRQRLARTAWKRITNDWLEGA